MIYRIVLFAGFIFASLTGIAQDNCNCPSYPSPAEQENSEDAVLKSKMDALGNSTNPFCVAKSAEWLANYYLDEQQYDSSEVYFRKAETYYKQSACNDSVLLGTYKFWAQLYYTKSDFVKSQECCMKLLPCTVASGNKFEEALCYTMIAQLLNQTDQAEEGIIYTRKAMKMVDQIEDPEGRLNILAKLSKRYLWHYQDTKVMSSLDSSELYSTRQLRLAQSLGRTSSMAAAYNNLQGVAYERGDFQKALALLDSAFLYTDKENYPILAVNYFDKADILIEMKQYDEAARMADSSLRYHVLEDNPAFIADAYSLISRINLLKGDYRLAYEYNEKARAITDSIRDVEKIKEVTELEQKYNQVQNEKTISELNQNQEISSLNIKLLTAGIIGALLIVLLVIIFFRQSVLKNKQVQLETEQRLNRARMNPHFFFNTLSALQTSALKEKDPVKMADLLSKYSRIMRSTLESTYDDLVTVEQEEQYLQLYLQLQQFRCNHSFDFVVEIDDALEPSELLMPGMIIQPFVENAIEHGFSGIENGGKLEVRFSAESGSLRVTVTDNGAGIGQGNNPKSHKSRATEITRDRLFLLNKKHKSNAAFEIRNNTGDSGVTVIITLPILH